jgi:two-component system, chemotaxis family, chemotaxis protein CheY
MVAASAIRVMVVDDDAAMRSLTRRSLQHVGFRQINDAKDPVDALPIARAERVHIIISDYDMPRMNGLQFVAALRKDPALAKIGFILLSGVADAATVTKAGELGVNSFIRKPFSIADLQHRVDAVFHQLTGSRIEFA